MKNKIIKVVICDFDGVIIEGTIPGMSNIIKMAEEHKVNIPSMELLQKYWGETYEVLLSVWASELNWPKEFTEIFWAEFFKKDLEVDYYNEKIIKALWKIKYTFGMELVILTNRPRKSLLLSWPRLKIDYNFFYYIQTVTDCAYRKPDVRVWDSVFSKLNDLNITVDEVVYVGDTIKHDMKLAVDYKPPLPFIGVMSGAVPKDQFYKVMKEKYLINSITELPDKLEALGWCGNGEL